MFRSVGRRLDCKRVTALSGAVLLGVFAIAGCVATQRRPAPPTLITQVAPVGFSRDIRLLSSDLRFFQEHEDRVIAGVRAVAGAGPVRILALSGGGAGGAFGAGVLIGWTRSGSRPQFHIVTGVSAGALLAPFAFLGPDWDSEIATAFSEDRFEHLLKPSGPLFFVRSGFFKGRPLFDLVDEFVTDRLIEAVAEQAGRGRVLLIATTDVDKQESVIWNMGAIAQHGGREARELFRDIVIASASIPGLLPPVLIRVEGDGQQYDEMHADGGTTVPLFVTSEIALLSRDEFSSLAGAQVYVVVNGQLSGTPETTRLRTVAVLARGLSAGLMHLSRRTVDLTADFAQRFGMDFKFTFIPTSYPYRGSLDFEPAVTRALYDYAAHCAEADELWSTLEHAIDEGQRSATLLPEKSEVCPFPKTTE